MVNDDGSAKGLRTILRERGINTVTMKADDMRTVLSYHEDFATEDTIVENYLKGRGHKVYFLPKFHCELNPIERVWAQAKVVLPSLHKLHPYQTAANYASRTRFRYRRQHPEVCKESTRL